jgi:hypothetical protein
MPAASPLLDAALLSQLREAMPTSLDTAGLRDLGAGVLARGVFTARGVSAVYASKLKEVIDQLAAGDIGEGQARSALAECLDILGYDSEKGGFAGEEVPPVLQGTLQDLRSFRRLDLIVKTQLALMQGAGLQFRGQTPERLATFPAWELVRVLPVGTPRDWPSRWLIAGGQPGPLIALKGDPVWGELGSYDNFQDALGVDHPPFAFSSGMGWREVSAAEVEAAGITGPNGETPEEFHSGMERPRVMAGALPLPSPSLSLDGVDPDLIRSFQQATHATASPGTTAVMDYSDILEREIANRDSSRAASDAARQQADLARRNGGAR